MSRNAKRRTLRERYIVVGCLLIMGFLICLFVSANILRDNVMEVWNHHTLRTIVTEIYAQLREEDWEIPEEDMENLAVERDVVIAIADPEQNVLFSTRSWEVSKGTFGEKTRKVIQDGEKNPDSTGNSFASYFDDRNWAYFVEVRKVPEFGYIVVRKSITGLNSSMQVMFTCFLIAAVITMVVGALVIIYLSGKMVQPILEINKVTGQIANLNFDEKVAVSNNNELGTLAESVNVMSDRLKESMGKLQKEVEMREALVRNMSHELKTPVAVIMGYAENMAYIKDQPEKIEKYCNIISEECSRMDVIIHRMLEDSSSRQGGLRLKKTEFSAEELFGSLRKYVEDEFPERKQKYEEVLGVSGTIRGDQEMIRRALYNFLKNAVAYGKPDGRIRICARSEGELVRFSVFNEGAPIPLEEQEKIWDVFYKVNRARTRKRDSFGIGLSIVKQAAEAHGGEVGVQNLENGVEFWFTVKNAF